jgi:putative MATE family efflux protein
VSRKNEDDVIIDEGEKGHQEILENVARQNFSIEELAQNESLLNKRIWTLAWPAMLELLLMSLFGMIDMVMVGNINEQSLAAVGLSNQPTQLALAVFQALNVGSTALVARFIGAGDKEKAKAAVRQSLVLVLIMGTAISILGFIFAGDVVAFMGAEPDVLPLGTVYFQIISVGWIFTTISMGMAAVLRGVGDTMTPMRYNIISNSLNVLGNYILIYGKLGFPAMGVAGAALSTTITRGIAAIMALYAIYKPGSSIGLSLKDNYRFDKDLLKRLLNVGLPSAAEQLLLRTGQLVFVRTVASLGTSVIAAHQIVLNVFSISFTPGMAFGMAATTLVGQSLGARRPDIAERCGYEARRIGMYIAMSMAVVFFFFGSYIADLFTNEPDIIAMAATSMKIIAVIQPMQSTQFILAGALRGAGDTRWPLYSSFIGIWGIRIVLAKLFIEMGWGLVGAWLAQGCDQIFRSIFIYSRYKTGHWKKIRV